MNRDLRKYHVFGVSIIEKHNAGTEASTMLKSIMDWSNSPVGNKNKIKAFFS